jgi:DNA-binding NtrC family response regulator
VRIAQALTEGRLREDLYYRLSTFTLEVPPLRERKDEIPLLLGHFMKLISKEHGLPTRPFSSELLEAAQCYSWPGNLRELENFVERYIVMGDDSIARKELEPKRGSHTQHARPANVVECPSNSKTELDTSEERSSLKTLVRNVQGVTEKNAITSALAKTNWNRKAAAQLLSISYRGLLYKIQQYALSPPPLHNSSLTKGH